MEHNKLIGKFLSRNQKFDSVIFYLIGAFSLINTFSLLIGEDRVFAIGLVIVNITHMFLNEYSVITGSNVLIITAFINTLVACLFILLGRKASGGNYRCILIGTIMYFIDTILSLFFLML